MALTPKNELFVKEYLIDLNGTQAAIRAGYSAKTASVQSYDLLRKPQIQQRINELRKENDKKLNTSRERLAQELARIAYADPRKLFDENGACKNVSELDDDTAGAVAGIETTEEYFGRGETRLAIGNTKKIKLSDKVRAAEALAKMMGYNSPDKAPIDLDGKAVIPVITINVIQPDK